MNKVYLNTDQMLEFTNFRLYLRKSFYHDHYSDLVDLLYQNIPSVIDVQFDDIYNKITIRTRKRKGYTDSSIFYNDIERSLLSLYNNNRIDSIIFSDNTLPSEQKDLFINIHNSINQNYGIKYLYNALMIDQYIYLTL